MKKSLLIYNPNSGNSNILINNFDKIIQKFQKKGFLLTIISVDKNLNKIVEIINSDNFHNIIISGGDGTLSKIISILYKHNINLPIGLFPSGTSNDFGRCLDINIELNSWVDNILDGTPQYVDFGLVNNKEVFLSSYAGGLFARISYDTDQKLKKSIGKLAYYISGLTEIVNIKNFDLEIEIDNNEIIKEKAVLYVILNGKGVGGFDNIVNNADMFDGYMDIFIIKSSERYNQLSDFIIKALHNNLEKSEAVRIVKTKTCKIKKINEDIGISIDGEKGKNIDTKIDFINNWLQIYMKNK